MIKVKIKNRKYYGEIISNKDDERLFGRLLIRYKLEDGRQTTGWFKKDDIEEIEKEEFIEHNIRVTKNYEIQCIKCLYKTVVEKKEDYGYCPNCMGRKWTEVRYVGKY